MDRVPKSIPFGENTPALVSLGERRGLDERQ
jgi:hypothetical protein